jgi:hypothetical protein
MVNVLCRFKCLINLRFSVLQYGYVTLYFKIHSEWLWIKFT